MKPTSFLEAELLQRLLTDQEESFQREELLSVESYLRQYPELHSRTEDLLTLIYNEIVLREHRGDLPRQEDYTRRFPNLARELRMQFDMHELMKGLESRPNGAEPT